MNQKNRDSKPSKEIWQKFTPSDEEYLEIECKTQFAEFNFDQFSKEALEEVNGSDEENGNNGGGGLFGGRRRTKRKTSKIACGKYFGRNTLDVLFKGQNLDKYNDYFSTYQLHPKFGRIDFLRYSNSKIGIEASQKVQSRSSLLMTFSGSNGFDFNGECQQLADSGEYTIFTYKGDKSGVDTVKRDNKGGQNNDGYGFGGGLFGDSDNKKNENIKFWSRIINKKNKKIV
jgi:hypothetical protein